MGTAAAGSFTAVGAGAAVVVQGSFGFALWGSFVATVTLERQSPDGTAWIPLSVDNHGTPNAFTVPVALIIEEPAGGVAYRVRCSSWTSGVASWAFDL
jgi:hypothetical protein